VREAVVLADNDRLIAYLVTSAPQTPQVYQAALRERLPDYMVPAYLMCLDSLPLTPNGKLDRKALPSVDASLLLKGHVAPVTLRQQQVAAIWAEVLGVPQVGLRRPLLRAGRAFAAGHPRGVAGPPGADAGSGAQDPVRTPGAG